MTRKQKSTLTFTIIGICLIVLGIILFNRTYEDFLRGYGIFMVFFGALCIYGGTKYDPDFRDAIMNSAEIMSSIGCSYNKDYKTLYVKQKSPEFRKLLQTQKHNVKTYDYVKPTYTYSSATVGGVTTGGISKSGDYYKSYSHNSNYEMLLVGAEGGIIEKISLTPELADKARQSTIGKYFDKNSEIYKNYIQVVEKVEHSAAFTQAMAMGMTDLGVSLMNQEEAAGYPSQEKCNQIIDWLSGT